MARLFPFVAMLSLSGCYVDTSSMNTDRFVEQTRPIFYVDPPVVEAGVPTAGSAYVAPPNTLPRVPLQPTVRSRQGLTPLSTNYPVAPRPVVKAGLPVGASAYYDPSYEEAYAAYMDKDRTIPAIPYRQIEAKYLRQEVDFPSADRPGTVIVDTKERLLYLVLGNGRAMRYGVGIGRQGFSWSGRGTIQWRQRWPRWTPPDEMVERQPEIAQFSAANGGMNGGLANPLGARALYIFRDGKDSLFRIHGTPEWRSIGKAVSSGCVRMLNQDVIDLYDRLPEKAEIIVM
jgi:lipoprotein-anchoring transpeptidase ErfK/SrfK